MKKNLHLLPVPKRLTLREGTCALDQGCTLLGPNSPTAAALADALERATGERPGRRPDPLAAAPGMTVRLVVDRKQPPQGYTLSIRKAGVEVAGGDDPGLYYGTQTLCQVLRQCGPMLPRLRVEDRPDFPVRGFYHDVTRGKVPTLDTLFALVDKMAHYKLNQLQLYVEHTFAFRRYAAVWAGADPLTAEDILRLDEHCRRHHVDLVPSLSTFGHFCTFLKSPGLERLNELPIEASRRPFSWTERLAHYTLDCSNPDSLALVEELIGEYAPLFRSRLFNIGCDETFDLGRGRNASRAGRIGKGRLYLDFVKKIMRAVRQQGKTPMLWGDIILSHPERVPELPREAVVLNWDYSPDLLRGRSDLFAKAGRRFYVCPGVHGWRGWLNQVDDATANILRQARAGRKHGAEGLLNTDWGDCGHVGFLSGAYHGLILGAAAGWHVEAHHEEEILSFDRAVSVLEFGDATGRLVRLLRRLGRTQVVDWKDLVHWLEQPRMENSEANGKAGGGPTGWDLPMAVLGRAETAYSRMGQYRQELERILADVTPRDPLMPGELRAGAEGADLVLMTALALKRVDGYPCRPSTRTLPLAGEVAGKLRRFEGRVARLWHLRNRPSEYFRLRLALIELANRLDRWA